MSKIWWTKMEHVDDFVAHYSELSDSEIVVDVRRSIASFANHRPEGDDFGAKMVRKALDRINEKHDHAVEAGALGGMAKAAKTITAAATTREDVDVSTTGCEHSSPDASDCKAEWVITNGSPITRNGSRAACTSATSGQTIETTETLDKAGAGEVPPENVSAKPSPALPVISFGEFGNIKMTNMQYAKLCERFGFADTVIEEADQYFEAQPAKKKKYKNHYAMLLNWCKRKADEQKPKQGYKNINDINRETYEKSKREIHAMFHPEEAKAV